MAAKASEHGASMTIQPRRLGICGPQPERACRPYGAVMKRSAMAVTTLVAIMAQEATRWSEASVKAGHARTRAVRASTRGVPAAAQGPSECTPQIPLRAAFERRFATLRC